MVIDALFGTGLSREISGELANDIDVLNQLSGWKVAVDIASGICSDDGAVLGTAFRADDTITFSFGKKGQYLWPGNEYCGKVHVVSMGITQESWLDNKPHTAVLEPEDLKKLPSSKGIWAPCLTWCESENLFYVVYGVMNSMNAGYFEVDNYLITASDIKGPWSEPVYLHSAGFDI